MQLESLSRWRMDGLHLPKEDEAMRQTLGVHGCSVAKELRFFGAVYGAGDLVYVDNRVYEVKVCIQIERAEDVPQIGWIHEHLVFVEQLTSIGSQWRRGGEPTFLILDEALQPRLRLVNIWSGQADSYVVVYG